MSRQVPVDYVVTDRGNVYGFPYSCDFNSGIEADSYVKTILCIIKLEIFQNNNKHKRVIGSFVGF